MNELREIIRNVLCGIDLPIHEIVPKVIKNCSNPPASAYIRDEIISMINSGELRIDENWLISRRGFNEI